MNIVESNGLLQLNKKLQYLKFAIKAWSKESNSSSSINKSDLHDIDSIEALEIPQKVKKAKIHWSIEGDENSKYFHDILNNKQSQLSVSGILDKGDWIDDPSIVKMKFLEHFSHHISKPVSNCLKTEFPFPNQLSLIHVNNLDCEVSYDEIKSVIWKCGMNKSPGLDGSTFKFFCKFWSTIKNDVVAAAKAFFSPGIFNGISLNESLMPLVYADNDVSVGEWDVSNIKTLVYVLKGVEKATCLIGFSTFSTPFNYLGVKPGDDMSKINSCDEVTSKVGNGEDTKFLEDTWLNEASLKVYFPRVYDLESQKDISVADISKDTTLAISFRRSPRARAEEEQFQLLHSRVHNILLP
ncbi:hypothetical protein Tco_0013986 [Tanacetum coccineum]